MEYPKRKQIRLAEYDYSSPGSYFITICTQDKRCILSDITVGEGLAPPEPRLTAIGKIVGDQILDLSRRYPAVDIDKHVIMPNHVHLIVSIQESAGGASPSPTLYDVVRVLKSLTTRLSRRQLDDSSLWQRTYHEHGFRNERDFLVFLLPHAFSGTKKCVAQTEPRTKNAELRLLPHKFLVQ